MAGNLPIELEESIHELLGKRAETSFRRMVRIDVKVDKNEPRILVLTDYRMFVLIAKSPVKIEHSQSYLELSCLESKKPTQLVFVTTESRRLSLTMKEADVEEAIKYVTTHLRKAFPSLMPDQVLKMDLHPVDRQQNLSMQPRDSMLRDMGPCGGYSNTYEAMCDYHQQPFLEEVAWDVDTIYSSQDSKELNLSDFDHLGIKHIVPIISALRYNTWFTSLNANNVKLTTEAVNAVLRVMRSNTTLQELHLRNVGAKWDFAHKLAMALLYNPKSQLCVLDFSENPIEDRGMNHLNSPLRTLQKGLTHLNLARTAITPKGINRLADALCANKGVTTSLTHLDLSDNVLKGEDITNLYNFWAQPNVITNLQLSGTECALENLFGALLPGCCQYLTHLDLSHNVFSHRRTKDVHVPPAWKQFFASAQVLKVLNLSDTKLTAEALKNVLLGIASNLDVTDVELDVSGNNLRSAGADILQMALPEIRNIHTLNISDNGFDTDMVGICSRIRQCESIKNLLIGCNFNVKPKMMGRVMDSVVQMIQDEESTIESLSLADSRLKNDTTLIINALGSNSSLMEIDLSGNLMSDVGVRMLAKALQINKKLHTIYWDRNGTTAHGFADIAQGLTKNYSIKKMPSPINDAAIALRLNADKTEQALQKIEEVLKRNHSPRKLASDQGYRLHQGFLISSSQQMLDRLAVQVQEHITTLEKGKRNLTEDAKTDLRIATQLVRDAKTAKKILPKLQEVALEVETDGNRIDSKLTKVSNDLHSAIQLQLKRTMTDMIKCMEQQCPAVMEDYEFMNTLQTSSLDKIELSTEFTKKLLIDHVGADIMNKVSELNLVVAAHISDRITDGVLDSLDECHKKLTNHINSADNLTSPLQETQQRPPRPEKLPSRKTNKLPSPIDDEFDEAAAQSTIKRKSLYSRRLRPQSVIDAADVKRALKMTEIDISNGGQGRLAEEEHESDSPKVEHGMKQGDVNAHPAIGVVASELVKGGAVNIVDDSLTNLDNNQQQSLQGRSPLNRLSDEPMGINDMEHKSILPVVAKGESELEKTNPIMVTKDAVDEVNGDDVAGNKDKPEDEEEEKAVEDEKDESERDDKVNKTKVKFADDEREIETEIKLSRPEKVTAVTPQPAVTMSDAFPEATMPAPVPEPRLKKKMRSEKVARPDSKVISLMNPGFLAALSAGIGGRKEKDKQKDKIPEDAEAGSKTGDNDMVDSSRSKELSSIPQSPSTPKSPSPSIKSTSSASDISLPPLEELPKLEHLGKSRPRRNKTHATSRAALKLEQIEDIKEGSDGVDEFFEQHEVNRTFKEGVLAEDREKEKGDEEKKEDSGKKKNWSPFGGQSNAKGVAEGISSLFGRRDKSSPSNSPEPSRRLTGHTEEELSRSPEPARRGLHRSPKHERRNRHKHHLEKEETTGVEEETKKKDDDASIPPWKRGVTIPILPPGGTGGSTSGGASALLAEMRAKRASTNPSSPTSSKGENKENKDSNKDTNKETSTPSKDNRNSIHPPSSVKDRSSVAPSPSLLRMSTSQPRPVPAPRSNSPATTSDKPSEKSEKNEEPWRPKSMFLLSKANPPPIAPKPRSKPNTGSTTTSCAKPTIITTPRTSVYARIRDNPPQRARSMYGGECPKRDDGSTSSGINGRARHDKAADNEDGGQDTPNGAPKTDGEFVLFL